MLVYFLVISLHCAGRFTCQQLAVNADPHTVKGEWGIIRGAR